MKNPYIYVPGLSEAVAAELKAESADQTGQSRPLIGITGAKKRYTTIYEYGVLKKHLIDDRNIQIPLNYKFALTIKEAAELYDIPESELKDYVREHPDAPFLLTAGAKTLINRAKFEDVWPDTLPEALLSPGEDRPPAKAPVELPLWERPLLTVIEAAKYFQVGESNIRRLTRECPKADFIYWRDKTRVFIRREAFERYLNGRTDV